MPQAETMHVRPQSGPRSKVWLLLTIWVTAMSTVPMVLAQHAHGPGARCAATAYAVPLRNITIDGKLNDWPDDMIRYQILNNWNPYGPTDIEGQSLKDNPDLSSYFMVGYEPKQKLLYVAFVVRDDSHVTLNESKDHLAWETDAVEIYLDGLHSERHDPWYERTGMSHWAAIQYVGHVGPGGPYGEQCNPHGDNPLVKGGRASDLGARVKGSRQGDETVYEWSLKIFDHYPKLTSIAPGTRIGFDAVVTDMDLHDGQMTDRAAWVPFGKRGPCKFKNSSSMADLVFVTNRGSLGTVSGQLTMVDEGKSHANIVLEAWRGMLPGGEADTDASGMFEVHLPAGTYTIRPKPDQGIRTFKQEIEVKAGDKIDTTIDVHRILDTTDGEEAAHEHHH